VSSTPGVFRDRAEPPVIRRRGRVHAVIGEAAPTQVAEGAASAAEPKIAVGSYRVSAGR
jgi:hypothetical protein